MPPHETTPTSRSTHLLWAIFVLVAIAGAGIRIMDTSAWRRTAPDEMMYMRYVNLMDGYDGVVSVFPSDQLAQKTGYDALLPFRIKVENTGATAMPDIVEWYIAMQRSPHTLAELPPTRFLYIYSSWLWKRAQFGNQPPLNSEEAQNTGKTDDYSNDVDHRDPALASLHRVALLFNILLVLAGGFFAWRMFGVEGGVAVLALLAFDPLQLHLSQHAMVDGFFAFWATMALWTTWECLRANSKPAWPIVHGIVLAFMVMTKENAFFVYVGLAVAVVANRWLRFGVVTPRFIAASLLGGLLGLCGLIFLSGGADNLFEIYRSLVSKAQNMEYARLTGDGPWYRYLLDLMTLNPIVLCLAIGAIFCLFKQLKEAAFLALFVAGSYIVMCNVRYGMNLRYSSIWSMPLCALAFMILARISAHFQRRGLILALAVVALSVYEIRQYATFFTNREQPLYELVPSDLLRQIKMLKS
jgi:hypothetical protein